MPYTDPKYENARVDAAGDCLAYGFDSDEADDDLFGALDVIYNWRAAHAYPLNAIQLTLRKRARRVDSQAIVAQRIKRLPSIIDKLLRYPDLKLSEMQDIGGCRVIVSTVAQVYELVVRDLCYRVTNARAARFNRHETLFRHPHPGRTQLAA